MQATTPSTSQDPDALDEETSMTYVMVFLKAHAIPARGVPEQSPDASRPLNDYAFLVPDDGEEITRARAIREGIAVGVRFQTSLDWIGLAVVEKMYRLLPETP